MKKQLLLASLCLSIHASFAATNYRVTVGNGNLSFVPGSITAREGDTVTFIFKANNHSVVQSSYDQPCTPLENIAPGGFHSDFFPVANGTGIHPTLTIELTDALTPVWAFCGQKIPTSHCHAGMVFAINPHPSGNLTFEEFQSRANLSSHLPLTLVPAPTERGSIALVAIDSSATGSAVTTELAQAPAEGTHASSAPNLGIILGITFGVLVVLVVGVSGCILVRRRRRSRREQDATAPSPYMHPQRSSGNVMTMKSPDGILEEQACIGPLGSEDIHESLRRQDEQAVLNLSALRVHINTNAVSISTPSAAFESAHSRNASRPCAGADTRLHSLVEDRASTAQRELRDEDGAGPMAAKMVTRDNSISRRTRREVVALREMYLNLTRQLQRDSPPRYSEHEGAPAVRHWERLK